MLRKQLRVKYRLQSPEPSALQIARWRSRAKSLIRFGFSFEKAGRMAAKEVFESFEENTVPQVEADAMAAFDLLSAVA